MVITPDSGLICHGGTLHGGRLTGHDYLNEHPFC